jgi:hypothetical protein
MDITELLIQKVQALPQESQRKLLEVAETLTKSDSPRLSPPEFARRLDELSEGLSALPTLPADWSRDDIYADRD